MNSFPRRYKWRIPCTAFGFLIELFLQREEWRKYINLTWSFHIIRRLDEEFVGGCCRHQSPETTRTHLNKSVWLELMRVVCKVNETFKGVQFVSILGVAFPGPWRLMLVWFVHCKQNIRQPWSFLKLPPSTNFWCSSTILKIKTMNIYAQLRQCHIVRLTESRFHLSARTAKAPLNFNKASFWIIFLSRLFNKQSDVEFK